MSSDRYKKNLSQVRKKSTLGYIIFSVYKYSMFEKPHLSESAYAEIGFQTKRIYYG
jgi:hypothetical protein